MHARLVPLLAVALLAFPVGHVAAQVPGPSVNFNVDQEVVRPGGDVRVTLYSYAYGQGPSGGLPVTASLERLPADRALDWRNADSLGTYASKTTTLDPNSGASSAVTFYTVASGLYRLRVSGGSGDDQTALVQVTDLGLVVQTFSGNRLVWAVRLSDGSSVPGAVLHTASGNVTTASDGVALVRGVEAVTASSLAGPAHAEAGYAMPEQAGRIFVYTDRPLYRPGQTVHAKLVAWTHDARPAQGAATLTASVWRNGRTETVASVSAPLDDYGTARADFDLPAHAGLGSYDLMARLDGIEGHGGFDVQEYRLPGFQVVLSPTATSLAAGGDLQVLVAAKRFNGNALDRGQVHWSLEGYPIYPVYSCWEGCGTMTSMPQPEPQQGDLELEPDGTALLHVKSTVPGSYTLSVQVTAPNGERIDASQALEIAAADARLSIDLGGYGFGVGKPFDVHVHLTDLAGHAIDGTVLLKVSRTDAYGQSKTPAGHTVLVRGGEGVVTLTADEAGSYQVDGTATDAAGRAVTASAWMWVAEDGADLHVDTLQLRALKATLPAGQAAEFRVASPRPQPVLVTMPRGDTLEHRVLGSAGLASFPTDGASQAAARALAVQVWPDPAFLPQLQQASAETPFASHPKALDVVVTPDRSLYSNGETARVLIQVRDAAGRPVRAEVSLAMVDEALLALHHGALGNAIGTLYPDEGGAYPESSWQNRYGGYPGCCLDFGMGGGGRMAWADADALVFNEAAPMAMMTTSASAYGFTSAAPEPPGIAVRSYFPETGLWVAQAETDAKGILRLGIELPDSLTTWKLQALAVTMDGGVGTGTGSLSTMRDIETDLYAPRFLVVGDTTTAQATVYNHLPQERDIQVLLKVDGVEQTGRATRTLTLAPGASGLVSFPLSALASGTAQMTFYAWTDGEDAAGDAIQRTIPVKPHGTPSIEARSGRGEATIEVTVPDNAAEGVGILHVTLSPTMGNAMVDALPFLTGFPYGCVEQTLSRFLPDVAVSQAAKSLNIPRDRIDADLDEQVEAGLERLYGFQHASGAWGWWTDDPDNEYTTAYTIYGLGVAKAAGYAVDENVLSRGVAALREMAKSSTGALHAYHVYALSVADPGGDVDVPDAHEPAELAMAILARHAAGDDAWGRARLDRLVGEGIRTSDQLHWPDPVEGWTSHGMSSDTMVTALALRAIVAVAPDSADADAAVRWLLSNRAGSNWDSTKDTAEAIFALVDYLRAVGDASGTPAARVRVDQQVKDVAFPEGDAWTERPGVNFTLAPGTHTVHIEPVGTGILYWGTSLRTYETAEPIRADQGAFTFTRTITKDGEPVVRLKVGDEAVVTVGVQGDAGARYVQVEDPLAAGTEVVQDASPYASPYGYGGGMAMDCWEGCRPYTWANAEVHDDRVAFFADALPSGYPATYTYTIRAIFPGCYHVLPPRAEGMYDPDLVGHGDESELCIDAPPALEAGRFDVVPTPTGATAQVNLHDPEGLPETVEVVVRDETGQVVSDQPRVPVTVGGDGIGRIELPVPLGNITLVISDGEASVVVRHQDVPGDVDVAANFNQTLETVWRTGSVRLESSPLHRGAAAADYGAVFAGIPKDSLASVPGPIQGTPWPASWSLLGIGLALVAWARRRT